MFQLPPSFSATDLLRESFAMLRAQPVGLLFGVIAVVVGVGFATTPILIVPLIPLIPLQLSWMAKGAPPADAELGGMILVSAGILAVFVMLIGAPLGWAVGTLQRMALCVLRGVPLSVEAAMVGWPATFRLAKLGLAAYAAGTLALAAPLAPLIAVGFGLSGEALPPALALMVLAGYAGLFFAFSLAALFFAQAPLIVVEEGCGAWESLAISAERMRGGKMALFVANVELVLLPMFAFILLHIVTCGLGPLLLMPVWWVFNLVQVVMPHCMVALLYARAAPGGREASG